MPVRARGRLGPRLFGVNWVRHGVFGLPRVSSWSARLGPWSWNSRTRKHRVDLPGKHHWWQSKKREK